MYKKVVYVVKNKMHYYPPCISQIRMLNKLGVDVEVLYGTSDESIVSKLQNEGIVCKQIGGQIDYKKETKFKKTLNWCRFRKAFISEVKNYTSDTLFWFGTAETILAISGKLKNKNYIITFLELMDHSYVKKLLLKKIVSNAKAITVCEEVRGYLMQNWWKLKELPYVFPNKPYDNITTPRIKPSCDVTRSIIDSIKDKKVILYQGIIQNTEEILEVAKALKEINSDYHFLLMGIDKYNSVEKIKEIYDKTLYFNYVPAPLHLEITSYARFGIAYYRPDSLNKVFCAPNKIYEYAGFGIPTICNNIPGLTNTVGKYNAGMCVKFTSSNIASAIQDMENSYEIYSQNSKLFFEKTDTLSTMAQLIDDVHIAR